MPNPVPPDTWHPPLPLPASDGVDEVAAAHAPSPVDDGIDALVVSQDQQRQNAAVASMNAAKTMDPERTGKAMELALRYGISPDLANREYELLSGQRRFDDNLDAADFTQLYKERPELAKWLLRPENAAVADGDVQYLKDVNDHVAAYVRATTDPRAKMPWLSYLTTKYTTGLGETAMPVVATLATLGAIPKDWFYGIVDREQAMAKAEAEGFQPPTGAMRVISPTLNFMGDPLSLLPMALGAKLAVKGVRATQALKDAAEIGSAAFGKIEAAAAAKGAAAGMGAQAFGQSLVSSSLATGQKPGAPEYSEALAQGTLATLFGRVMGLPVPARMAGVGGGAVGADALRQGATMAAQNVAALFPPMLTGKPAPTTGEMWMQALIGGTSGVALGIGNLPSAWAHGQAVERINRTIEAHQSLGAMDSIQAAIKAATDSATLKRSSSATEDLIRQVAAQQGAAGGLTLEQSSKSLWFPAKEIDTYLRGKGVSDPAATLEGMGVEKKAYEQAMGTGSKVEVPIEKLIVQLAKDGTAAEVLPMASIGPDRKSFAEESDWLKGLPENLAKFKEQVRGEIKTDPFATPDGKEIYQDWYQRLREIGKGSEEAKTQALFLQRGFEIAAGKYNQGEGKKIAPADLYKHFGMQIQRVLPDVLANPQIRKLMDEPLTALRVAAQKGEIPENLQGLSKALKQAGIDISKHKTNQEVFDALHQGMAAQQGAGEHLVDGRPIVKAHIPYGGGWSRDGNHLYIDERIPRYMDIDGKPVDVHALIARHEIVEKGEMDKGMKYKDAHKIATNAEHDEARSLGVNPKSYERALAPLLKQVKASSDKAKIPIDLDSRTYNQSEEGHLIKGAKGDPLKLMHTEQVAKVQMQGDERTLEQSGWHGTGNVKPYDRLSTDYVGGPGGEGHQAFGWGLYIAGKKDLGAFYRDKLSRDARDITRLDGKEIWRWGNEVRYDTGQQIDLTRNEHDVLRQALFGGESPVVALKDIIAYQEKRQGDYAKEILSVARSLLARVTVESGKGKLYTLEIPENEEFLDRDQPVAEQGEPIQKAIAEIGKYLGKDLLDVYDPRPNETDPSDVTGASVYENLALLLQDKEFVETGKNISIKECEKRASLLLKEHGIPGMVYLAGDSRAKGEGNHNYVIFDDSRIAIKSYEQTSGEGPPRGSITFGPMSSIIKLYMGENLSTLIHEESHVLFNVFGKLAGMDDAPTDLKADWGALLKHIGAKDTESMTERQHEQLAEEMEHYLMEGKVPGQELRSAFQRIKSWMVQVYRSIKDIYRSSGGVPMLNDEVRGIFDRMLASEDEIAAAHNKLSDGPIFKDATAAGMTQAEFTDYNKRWAHGDADARDSLYEDMREQMMAPRTKVYEKALASAHEEAISNLNHDKAIAAVRHLQDGVRPDGEKSFPFPFKLDKNQLVKEYGEGILKELPGKATYSTNPNNHGEPVYASAGGLYLQSACDFLGFKSTDELVQALKGARDLSATADVMAHDKLRTQFPDMYMDGDLDKAAVEKIHGEELAALHEADTKRLADMAGKQVVPRAIMKSMAKQAVGDMKPVDIKPGLYESAEARANKESLKAMSKGDFATAMAEREKSQINRELFKAAVGAKEEANDIHDNLVRFDKPKVREAIARGGGKEFLDQIDQLREGVALKSRSQMQAAEPIPSLGQFELKQLHKGIPIAIPPDVLMEPPQKHWTDLTLNELRGLNDALSNLEGTAKNLAEAVAKQRAAALKIKSDILSGALLENRGWSVYGPEGKARIFKHYATKEEAEAAAAKIPGATTEQTRVDRGAGTAPLSGLTRTIGDYWDKLKRPTDLVYRIQGHREAGPLFDMWSKPLNEAMDVQRVMTEHAYDILMKDLDKLSKLGFDNVGAIKLNQREAIPEIRDSLNKYAQFSVALNWGNAGNRERLLAGHHWTEDQVNAILDRLDDEDWDFVEAKWKQLASYKPQIEALERRVHPGREVKWVDATPFKTKTGREVSGGYYPIVYDNGRTPPPIHEMPDAMAKSMMEGFGYSHAMTDTGHVQARTGSQDRPLKLDIGVVDDHIGKVIHDLAMREVVIDLNQLVNNGQFKDTMVNAWGKGAWDAFNDQVHAVAHGPGLDDTGLGRILEFMRNGLNASMRSFNIAYSLKQVVGAPSSIARVGFGNWSRALIQVLTPGKAQWALDNSTELRLRNAERGTYLGDAFRRTGTLAFMEPFKNTAYLFANKAWHFLDTHAWLAGYNKAMDMPEVGGDHAKACAMANQIMIDTQGGFIGKDMAQALRGNAYNKIFTNMMSWGNANLGLMVNSMHRLADKHYTPEAAAHMVSDMLLYLVVAPAAYYAGSQVITGDDMSEWKDPKKLAGRLAKESAYTGFSGIPLARDAVSWISEGKRAELPQGLGGVGAIANFGTAVRNDIAHEMEGTEPHWAPTLRQGLKVGGVLTHFPSTQVLHMLDYYFYAEQHGKNVLSPRLLLGPPPKP